MITSVQGLAVSRQAFRQVFGREANDGEARTIDAISVLETNRTQGWRGAGAGSNNAGAIQCGSGWKGDRFVYTDTRPNADGTSTPYRAEFRSYPTLLDGYRDLVQVAYINRKRDTVREAAAEGLWVFVSEALHETGYYEGFGKTVADRIANHARSLTRALFSARGEQAPRFPLVGSLPTLEVGCHHIDAQLGEAVGILQTELRIAADKRFGPVTKAVVQRYQRQRGLSAEGKVGPATWRVLLGDDYDPSWGEAA